MKVDFENSALIHKNIWNDERYFPLEQLDEDGYLALENFVHPASVEEAKVRIDALFENYQSLPKESVGDLNADSHLSVGSRVPEIRQTVQIDPALRETTIFKQAEKIAKIYIGPDAELTFDHAIYKHPHSMTRVHWHQDLIYHPMRIFSPRKIHFWIPFQPVTENNGCMQFIKGSHKRALQKHQKLNAFSDLKYTENVDLDNAVICELPLGGATIHLGKTLHCTAPNLSQNIRRAWILQFSAHPLKFWKNSKS